MSVVANTPTPIESLPEVAGLWGVAHWLFPDWGQDIEVRTLFQTQLAMSTGAAEQRWSTAARPLRSITLPMWTRDPSSAMAAVQLMHRAAVAGVLAPLIPDTVAIESTAIAGTAALVANTSMQRFYVGQWCLLWHPDPSIHSEGFEVIKIETIVGSAIALTTLLASTWMSGARLTPLIEADPVIDAEMTARTDWHATGTITLLERPGPSALPPIEAGGVVPAWMQTHDGLPVWVPPVNMANGVGVGVHRHGDADGLGRGRVFTFYGDRPAEVFRLDLLMLTREKAWQQLQFIESRAGRAWPFWMLNPMDTMTIESLGNGAVEVTAVGAVRDWNHRPNLGIQLADGTVHIRDIAAVNRSGNTDTLTLSEALPAIDPADVVRVTAARLVRFDSDEVVERWLTDGHLQVQANVIELIANQDLVVDDLERPSTTAAEAVDPALCSTTGDGGGDGGGEEPDLGCVVPVEQDWLDNPDCEYILCLQGLTPLVDGCYVTTSPIDMSRLVESGVETIPSKRFYLYVRSGSTHGIYATSEADPDFWGPIDVTAYKYSDNCQSGPGVTTYTGQTPFDITMDVGSNVLIIAFGSGWYMFENYAASGLSSLAPGDSLTINNNASAPTWTSNGPGGRVASGGFAVVYRRPSGI